MSHSELKAATENLNQLINAALARRALLKEDFELQNNFKCLAEESHVALLDEAMSTTIPDSRPMLTKRQLSRHLGKRGRENS